MSEEKIIEILKKLISWKGMKVEIRDYEIEAIQGLLDLYKELKEKNASVKKEIKLMKSININDNYINKDKIRDKIKEYQNKLFQDIEENKVVEYENIIQVLEELLEEE